MTFLVKSLLTSASSIYSPIATFASKNKVVKASGTLVSTLSSSIVSLPSHPHYAALEKVETTQMLLDSMSMEELRALRSEIIDIVEQPEQELEPKVKIR